MRLAKRFISILFTLIIITGLSMPIFMTAHAASVTIVTQPKTSYTSYGKTAKVTVKAKGDGLKYTWYYKNVGASKFYKSPKTSATYAVTMKDAVNGRQVYCVVTDKYGKTVKSSTATLRMKATITTQPKTTYAKQGATAKVTVKAKGDGLKYTWYYKNVRASKFYKSQKTSATYAVTMKDAVNGRQVYCVVTDKYGKTVKSKTVVLRQSATIVTQPKSVTAENGKTAKVTVKAVGTGLKYVWYYKNVGASRFYKSAKTTATYSVTMSDKVSGRQIYCVVTDKYGNSVKSKTVSLKSIAAPLTITKQPDSTTASAGDQVGFGIIVTGGKAPYTYTLLYSSSSSNGWQVLPNVEVLTMGSMAELVFPVSFSDTCLYCIEVTDASGKKVTSNVVYVEQSISLPYFVTQPEDAVAQVGDVVSFTVEVAGGTGPYTYQWQYMCESFPWTNITGTWSSGYLRDTLTFEVTSKAEFTAGYYYRCIITDAVGDQVTSEAVCVIEQG